MKHQWMAGMMAAVMGLASVGLAVVPTEAEAKRLGGGKSQGMQRSAPPQNSPATTPGTPAQQAPAPAAAAAPMAGGAAAAAAAPKRNWMGPIAGLAAGLGIAALMSHLGMGEAFGNFLMMALLAIGLFFIVRLLMRRFAGAAPAGPRLQAAGAGMPPMSDVGMQRRMDTPAASAFTPAAFSPSQGSAAGALPASAPSIPADFDRDGFERIAKMIFIRLQTANDARDLNDLRQFTTPEMFAAIRLELQERGDTSQHTDVMKVDAEVIEVADETERQVVSVRFHGLVREESEAAATDFDEVWHLVKPSDDSRGWAIAGIQQR